MSERTSEYRRSGRDGRLRRRLRAWYRRNQRALPWRETRDPYRIWVSETMLQQTQVATVIPFYHSFLARFPTLDRLARAPLGRVLAAWAGLGYYRRARHLHEAARLLVRERGGCVPRDPDAFGRLPGVGRYTAGAVLSIAFDRPLAVLDGNVARVLSRLEAAPWSVRDPAGARALWARAQTLMPPRAPGDWNQALMELGAMVCTPAAPRCSACPLREECRAHAEGRVAEFPPISRRRPTVRVRRAVAVIERGGRLLVGRRSGALLDGLWEPPGVDLERGEDARAALRAELRRRGVRARLAPLGVTVRHGITHRAIEAELWRARPSAPVPRSAGLRFVDVARPAVALAALARKVARATLGRGG